MNKLARREYDYIKGNTVLAPERKSGARKEEKRYTQAQKRKKIISKNILLKNRRRNDRKYMVTVAVVIFSLGLITIAGDNRVYTMEDKVSNLNSQINQAQEENEALKVKILKFSSLNNIEKNAQSKLSMSIPKKEDTVKVDFSQNYFKDLKPTSSESNTKKSSLFSKLISLIK